MTADNWNKNKTFCFKQMVNSNILKLYSKLHTMIDFEELEHLRSRLEPMMKFEKKLAQTSWGFLFENLLIRKAKAPIVSISLDQCKLILLRQGKHMKMTASIYHFVTDIHGWDAPAYLRCASALPDRNCGSSLRTRLINCLFSCIVNALRFSLKW